MNVPLLLISAGVFTAFNEAKEVYLGGVCQSGIDQCLPLNSAVCAVIQVCEDMYEGCFPDTSWDTDYVWYTYNYSLPHGEYGNCTYLMDDFNKCDNLVNACKSSHCNGDAQYYS